MFVPTVQRQSIYHLWSSSTNQLDVPVAKPSTYGSRSFSVSGISERSVSLCRHFTVIFKKALCSIITNLNAIAHWMLFRAGLLCTVWLIVSGAICSWSGRCADDLPRGWLREHEPAGTHGTAAPRPLSRHWEEASATTAAAWRPSRPPTACGVQRRPGGPPTVPGCRISSQSVRRCGWSARRTSSQSASSRQLRHWYVVFLPVGWDVHVSKLTVCVQSTMFSACSVEFDSLWNWGISQIYAKNLCPVLWRNHVFHDCNCLWSNITQNVTVLAIYLKVS